MSVKMVVLLLHLVLIFNHQTCQTTELTSPKFYPPDLGFLDYYC